MVSPARIDAFDFPVGRPLAKKYEIIQKMGSGWEGEVYLIREMATRIERAAKFFYPQRNIGNQTLKRYAKKLHALRDCPIIVPYYTQETIVYRRQMVSFLVSEFVEGTQLNEFLKSQPGRRLSPFQAIHLLYALAKGIEAIHAKKEYHGDLHSGNVMVRRFGLGFDLKIIDFFHWNHPKPENIRDDIVDMIKLFHESLGGASQYAKQPDAVKAICCGLKKSLILKKFPTATKLRHYLESMTWG